VSHRLLDRLREVAGDASGCRSGREPRRTSSTGRSRAGRGGRVGWLRDGERGASAVEYAILTPVFLVLTFLIIQTGMYYYARNVAQSAAEDAARSARATNATDNAIANPATQPFPTDDELQQRAEDGFNKTLTALDPNGGFFQNRSVTAVGDQATGLVQVDVQGSSVNLLPHFFPTMNIHARAGGSVEIFKNPGQN
jgi:Flp pilus assembly protein TadG